MAARPGEQPFVTATPHIKLGGHLESTFSFIPGDWTWLSDPNVPCKDGNGSFCMDPLRTKLTMLWYEGTGCDITIVVGETGYVAHRCVLIAASEFFSTMLTGSFKESTAQTVHIHNVRAEVFELLLEFIYSGTIAVPEVMLQEILAAAGTFRLIALQSVTSKKLLKHVNPDLWMDMVEMAEAHALEDMQHDLKLYGQAFFTELVAHESFHRMPAELLEALLGSDDLAVDKEANVFSALDAWYKGQTEKPAKHVVETLLAQIRFPLMEPLTRQQIIQASAIGKADSMTQALALMDEGLVMVHKRKGLPKLTLKHLNTSWRWHSCDGTWCWEEELDENRMWPHNLFKQRRCPVTAIYCFEGYGEDYDSEGTWYHGYWNRAEGVVSEFDEW